MTKRSIQARNGKRGQVSTKTKRTKTRRLREKRAAYRAPRWKIPDVTPIGSDAPVSKTLPLAVKRIVETLHPEKIILFGSYAYGNPTPDSDVDLLVVVKNRKPHRENYLAVSDCLTPRPFAVDIILRTHAEMTAALANQDIFIADISLRGKTLYERPHSHH